MRAVVILGAVLLLSVATSEAASVRVRSHVTRSGTYVAPHIRTAPNRTKVDNYSTKGNVNPFTGKRGSK